MMSKILPIYDWFCAFLKPT